MKYKEEKAREAVERILNSAPDMIEVGDFEVKKRRYQRLSDGILGALLTTVVGYGVAHYVDLVDRHNLLQAENATLTKELLDAVFTDIPTELPASGDTANRVSGV